ncbi:MAG: polysaccharide biosynthesis C-terminal domain-containing protein [Oscillospiraceae bacterium]|nr:polysaccharide biosynthesis C-terminal domain-containing protein [Oscillospiraceae bacterium]
MIKQLLEKLRNFSKEGLFHIFGSRMISQICGLISSMVVIRHLEKVDYGYYIDAVNIYSYPAIFAGMGMANVIIQYCSERVSEERKKAIYRYAFLRGNAANILLAAVIAALAFWKYQSGKPQTALYLLMMCALPLVNDLDTYAQTVLRVKRQNQVFANANIIYSVVLLLGNIILTKRLHVPGLIYSRYVAYFVSAVICIAALQKNRFYGQILGTGERLQKTERRQINSYAAVCAITNFTSTVLTLLDVTCLELVLGDPTVLADYHVAAIIPSACTFVPSCLMVFFYPRLVDAISEGKEAGRRYIFQMAKVYAVVNGLVFLGIAVFAPFLIWVVYGEKYMNVIPLIQILNANYLVYCVRNLMGNTIAAIKKVKMNLYFAIISGILNIILNLTLIPWLGAVGAAVATLIVTITVAALDCTYVLHHFRKEK